MSSKWKLKYVSRYKGRGNCWIKIPYDSPASKIVKRKVSSFEEKGANVSDYIRFCDRQQFFWLRYHKIIGDEQNPFVVYEIRINGSKKDHKNFLISIPAKISEKFELLGNTPHKLNLEVSDQELLHIKATKQKKKEVKESNSQDELEEPEYIPNLKSYYEGTLKPKVNYRIPGREDIPKFEQFLIYENALEEEII